MSRKTDPAKMARKRQQRAEEDALREKRRQLQRDVETRMAERRAASPEERARLDESARRGRLLIAAALATSASALAGPPRPRPLPRLDDDA